MVTRTAILVLSVVGAARAASGQTPQLVPRWDLSAQTGVFVARPAEQTGADTWDRWYHAASAGISTGRYLTPHVKLEGEVIFTTEGERYLTRIVQAPGFGPLSLPIEQHLRTTSASAAVAWQFFENRWVHPFVLAGAAVDVEQERRHTFPPFSFRGGPPGGFPITESIEHATTTRARGLVGGGAKLYAGPRAFFRADTRIGIGSRGSAHVSFRIGFGVDL